MKNIRFNRQAEAELDEAIEWYESRRRGLGKEFRSEVEAAVGRVRTNFGIGSWYGETEFQFVLVHRFPYVVYFLDLPDVVWIAAVAHGKRQPGYWLNRTFDD